MSLSRPYLEKTLRTRSEEQAPALASILPCRLAVQSLRLESLLHSWTEHLYARLRRFRGNDSNTCSERRDLLPLVGFDDANHGRFRSHVLTDFEESVSVQTGNGFRACLSGIEENRVHLPRELANLDVIHHPLFERRAVLLG